MNQSFKWVAVAVALVGVAGTAAAGTFNLREASEKTVDARGFKGVRVENARGSVTVRAGSDGRLRLKALKVVRERDAERARRFADRTRVELSNDDGWWTIRVRYPQNESIRVGLWEVLSGFELPRVEVRITLEMPASLAANLRATSGDLVTEGIAGAQTLETASGDVTVRTARGPLEATTVSGGIVASDLEHARLRTVSGDLRIEVAEGPLTASTSSGDIAVKRAADAVDLSTSSGRVRVSAAPKGLAVKSTSGDVIAGAAAGEVRVESTSGRVSIGLQGPLRSAEVETASGDIVASLAPSLGGALEMRTRSGSLEVAVPLEVGTVNRHLVTGVIGRGSAPIRLRSVSGNIEVKSEGDLK